MLKRFITDFTIVENSPIGVGFFRLVIQHPSKLPQINAGQFVEELKQQIDQMEQKKQKKQKAC